MKVLRSTLLKIGYFGDAVSSHIFFLVLRNLADLVHMDNGMIVACPVSAK